MHTLGACMEGSGGSSSGYCSTTLEELPEPPNPATLAPLVSQCNLEGVGALLGAATVTNSV